MKTIHDTVTLHNGVKMPYFGLGVYKVEEGKQVEDVVKLALQVGYRSIDTAAFYKNEEGVGRAIIESGVPREELFITTKVWNTDQGYDSTIKAFESSLHKLGLEYLDLYLIHWPVKGKYVETWKALEYLYKKGKVRAIGVSNFQIHHLEDLFDQCEEKPTVNQVELHPHFSQLELQEFCKKHHVQIEAWSPMARARLLDEPILYEIGQKYNKTSAQVVLRWHLQHNIVIIPKSVTPERIKQNADIFDFELSEADMKAIDGLNKNHRYGQHPDHFNF